MCCKDCNWKAGRKLVPCVQQLVEKGMKATPSKHLTSEQCGVLLCHQMHEQLCFAEWHSENLLEIEPLSVLLQLF